MAENSEEDGADGIEKEIDELGIPSVQFARPLKKRHLQEDLVGLNSESKQYFCRFFQRSGCCWFQDDCFFSHDVIPTLPNSDLKIMLCSDYMKTGECSRKDCRHAHGKDELRTPQKYEGMLGYKAHFCTFHLLDDLECDKAYYECFDAHGPWDQRPCMSSVPPELEGCRFTYSDAHVHLDEVLLSRRYGSYWMHKRTLCVHDPCYQDPCAFAHGIADMRPRLQLDSSDVRGFADELATLGEGVFGGCVTSSCTVETIEETVQLVIWGRDSLGGRILAAFGIHPTHFEVYTPEVEAQIEAAIVKCGSQAVAWGECGLDYYHRRTIVTEDDLAMDPRVRDAMRDVFAQQARAAVRNKLPLVVHSREAEEDTLQVLLENLPRDHHVYLHSYQGCPEVVKAFVEKFPNGYIGLTGVSTYVSSTANRIRKTALEVPITRILLETDGPYLPPEPHRHMSSHAGHVPWIAHAVAQDRCMKTVDVLTVVQKNFCKFFNVEFD